MLILEILHWLTCCKALHLCSCSREVNQSMVFFFVNRVISILSAQAQGQLSRHAQLASFCKQFSIKLVCKRWSDNPTSCNSEQVRSRKNQQSWHAICSFENSDEIGCMAYCNTIHIKEWKQDGIVNLENMLGSIMKYQMLGSISSMAKVVIAMALMVINRHRQQ